MEPFFQHGQRGLRAHRKSSAQLWCRIRAERCILCIFALCWRSHGKMAVPLSRRFQSRAGVSGFTSLHPPPYRSRHFTLMTLTSARDDTSSPFDVICKPSPGAHAFSFAAINALGSGIYSAEVVIVLKIKEVERLPILHQKPAYGHLSVVEQTLSVMPEGVRRGE